MVNACVVPKAGKGRCVNVSRRLQISGLNMVATPNLLALRSICHYEPEETWASKLGMYLKVGSDDNTVSWNGVNSSPSARRATMRVASVLSSVTSPPSHTYSKNLELKVRGLLISMEEVLMMLTTDVLLTNCGSLGVTMRHVVPTGAF